MIISNFETLFLLSIICILGILIILYTYRYSRDYEIRKFDFVIIFSLCIVIIMSIILILRN